MTKEKYKISKINNEFNMPGHIPENLWSILEASSQNFSSRTVFQIQRKGQYHQETYQSLIEKACRMKMLMLPMSVCIWRIIKKGF